MNNNKTLIPIILFILLIGFSLGITVTLALPGSAQAIANETPTIPAWQITNTVVFSTLAAQQPTPTLTPTRLQMPTPTSTRVPTPKSAPSSKPTQYGPFVLTRRLYEPGTSVVDFRLPGWLVLARDEAEHLVRLKAVYDKAIQFTNEKDWNELAKGINEFLLIYPNSDGAIPALMMLGMQGDPIQDTKAYERAIALLMKRHPARINNILDDLIDLGLPIWQVQTTDSPKRDIEILLFSYHSFGDNTGHINALVREQNKPWQFKPVPIRYGKQDDWTYIAEINTVDDINGDGQDEIVVALHHQYAGGIGLKLHIFAWQDGDWVDRLVWNPLGNYKSPSDPDAYYGEFWLEDADKDGAQEIVIEYFLGSPGGGAPPSIDVYQWDAKTRTFSNTAPVKSQGCGYAAFAEAERLRKQGQFNESFAWYREARQRWLNELARSASGCVHRDFAIGVDELIAQSYRIELGIESDARIIESKKVYLVSAVEELNKETRTVSETTSLKQIRTNYFLCDTPACRLISRWYNSTEVRQFWESGDVLICTTANSGGFDRYPDGFNLDIQVYNWRCRGTDNSGRAWLEWEKIDSVNVCVWDGSRFRRLGDRIIYPSTSNVAYFQETRDRLETFFKVLPSLTDCSGDN